MSIQQSKHRGISLYEVLIVISILLILVAISIPIIASSKRSARLAATVSNLKQCGLAMSLYADNFGGFPVHAEAVRSLGTMPTCDESDYWRSSCHEDWGSPMVGSYGYVGLVGIDREAIKNRLSTMQEASFPLMASVWYGSERSKPFHGDSPPKGILCRPPLACMLPDRINYLMSDGSYRDIKKKRYIVEAGGATVRGLLFAWPNVFHESQFR